MSFLGDVWGKVTKAAGDAYDAACGYLGDVYQDVCGGLGDMARSVSGTVYEATGGDIDLTKIVRDAGIPDALDKLDRDLDFVFSGLADDLGRGATAVADAVNAWGIQLFSLLCACGLILILALGAAAGNGQKIRRLGRRRRCPSL